MELSVFSQSKPVSKDDSKKPFEVLNTDKLSILNLKQVVMFFMVFVALNKPESCSCFRHPVNITESASPILFAIN